MIKALIFDFGSVIYKTKWKDLNNFFFKKNGFNILVSNTNDEELIRIYKESDVGKEDFSKFFFRLNSNIDDINKVISDYKEGYSKFKVINKEMLDIISNLREQGFLLFGFTDIKKEHYEANVESSLYGGFEEVFASYKFGHLKSEKEAFEKLEEELKKYNLRPEECVFIDDHLENIDNAKEFGFKTIHYEEFPVIDSFKSQLNEIISGDS